MKLRIGVIEKPLLGGSVSYTVINALDWRLYPCSSGITIGKDLLLLANAATKWISENQSYESKVIELSLGFSNEEWTVAHNLLALLGIRRDCSKLTEEFISARSWVNDVGLLALHERESFKAITYRTGMLLEGLKWSESRFWSTERDMEVIREIKPISVSIEESFNRRSSNYTIKLVEMTKENVFLLFLLIYTVSMRGGFLSTRRRREARVGQWSYLPLVSREKADQPGLGVVEGSCYAKLAYAILKIIGLEAMYMRYWISLVVNEELGNLREATPLLAMVFEGLKGSKAEVKSPKVARAAGDIITVMELLGVMDTETAREEREGLEKRTASEKKRSVAPSR